MNIKPAENLTPSQWGLQLAAERTANELMVHSAPHQRAFLRLLATADRHRIDSALLISSFADELPTRYRCHAEMIVSRVDSGEHAIDALGVAGGLLTPTSELALRLARDEGTLPDLYQAILDSDSDREFETKTRGGFFLSRIGRLWLTGFFLFSILTFMMLRIVPEFKKMSEDFGVELTPWMALLISIADTLLKNWFLLFLPLLFFVPGIIRRLIAYKKRWNWFTWQQRTLTPSEHRKQALAMLTDSNRTGSTGFQTIAGIASLSKFFRRLPKVEQRIEQGADPWEALAAAKYISSRDAQALAQSTSPETQTWLLRWSARNGQQADAGRKNVLTRIGFAAAYVIIAGLVALAAVAIFSTLIMIMNELAQW